jgi:hypothetical protein
VKWIYALIQTPKLLMANICRGNVAQCQEPTEEVPVFQSNTHYTEGDFDWFWIQSSILGHFFRHWKDFFAPQQDMSRQRRGRGLPLKALAQNNMGDVWRCCPQTGDTSTGISNAIYPIMIYPAVNLAYLIHVQRANDIPFIRATKVRI